MQARQDQEAVQVSLLPCNSLCKQAESLACMLPAENNGSSN